MSSNKETESEVPENPNWIPGIYNYCDRWCERCAFTGKCRSFAMEINRDEDSGIPADTEAHDIRSREFWDDLSEVMNQTMEYLRKISKEEGEDSEAMNDQQWEYLKKRDEELEQAAREHPVALAAWKYSDLAETWLNQNKETLSHKKEELDTRVKLGAGGKRAATENELIGDALQIIRWYEPQIWVKLMRALTGKMGEEESVEAPKDSDGSAKVALIAIDRSLAAWGQLQFIFPELTNDFITLLLQLDRLRKQVEAEFPESRAFKRAGFDDDGGINA
jgi:hypothetical protein